MGLVLMGGAMLCKSLIQFSVEGWGCVSSLWLDLRPNSGGDNEEPASSPLYLLNSVSKPGCALSC